MLNNYLKNSSKRLTNLICLLLIAVMTITSLFSVTIDTTIFFGLIGLIAANNGLNTWQANNSQFNQNDVRSIVKGFNQESQ